MRLNHVFLFAVWGAPENREGAGGPHEVEPWILFWCFWQVGRMADDEARGVSRQQGRTWKKPLPRMLSDGSSQPMRRNPQTKKTWLPGEDSNLPSFFNSPLMRL